MAAAEMKAAGATKIGNSNAAADRSIDRLIDPVFFSREVSVGADKCLIVKFPDQ